MAERGEVALALLRLHELIFAGRGDGEEADAIRDRLDGPLLGLSPEARRRFQALSKAVADFLEIV